MGNFLFFQGKYNTFEIGGGRKSKSKNNTFWDQRVKDGRTNNLALYIGIRSYERFWKIKCQCSWEANGYVSYKLFLWSHHQGLTYEHSFPISDNVGMIKCGDRHLSTICLLRDYYWLMLACGWNLPTLCFPNSNLIIWQLRHCGFVISIQTLD